MIKNLYYGIPIRIKLIIIILILFSYPLIIIGYFGFRNYSHIMEEKSVSYAKKNVKELSALISERIVKLEDSSQKLLYDDTIYNLNARLTDLVKNDDSFGFINFNETAEAYLSSVLNSRPELNMVFFRFEANGLLLQKNVNSTYYLSKPIPADEIYKAAKSAGSKSIWYFEKEGGNVEGVYLARIVYDRDTLKEIGLLAFKINKEYIFNMNPNLLSDEMQNISVFSNDLELFSYNPVKADYQINSVRLLKTLPPDSIHEISSEGDDIYIINNVISPLNWKIVVYISSNILLKDVRIVSENILLLCLISLPMWLILITLLYFDIVRPMNLLIFSMHKIEKGKIGTTVKVNRSDELGFVFSCFNKMSYEIKRLIDTVYKEQLAMKDAEIKALQAQINPHFLFNTLECLNWKARIYGIEDLSEMISAFSSIIEANLNRGNEKLIPLYKEVDYIQSYNLLLQKQFGSKISYVINVQADIMKFKIPKLIIQPLIENAVYHGLETKKGNGIIQLDIRKENDVLIICVSDDGVGIDGKTLERLHKELSSSTLQENTLPDINDSKIGIINVHRRIQLLYGNEYGMEVSSRLGKGTTITVRLPADIEEGVKADVQSDNNR